MIKAFSTEGLKPGHWMNCWHCNGYFKFKDMRYPRGPKSDPACPFCGIDGIGMDIFRTNKPRDPELLKPPVVRTRYPVGTLN